MREIKFRAWDKKDKKMYQPKKLCRIHFNKEIPYAFYTWDGDIILHGGLILMQYTGLKDKNGKEIYEGDIVWSEGHQLHFIVEYQISMGGFMFDSEGLLMGVGQNADGMEIIGNIYENPELLK